MTIEHLDTVILAAGFDKIRILVVETDSGRRTRQCLLLEELGFRNIKQATSGPGALGQMGLILPVIVFYSTLVAPLDVVEFTRLIRKDQEKMLRFTVILGVGKVTEKQETEGRDAGINGFVTTPTVPSLARAIHVAIANVRKFVQTGTYFGPDRRIPAAQPYDKKERRTVALPLIAPPYLTAFQRMAAKMPPVGQWIIGPPEDSPAPRKKIVPEEHLRPIGTTRLGLAKYIPSAPGDIPSRSQRTKGKEPLVPPNALASSESEQKPEPVAIVRNKPSLGSPPAPRQQLPEPNHAIVKEKPPQTIRPAANAAPPESSPPAVSDAKNQASIPDSPVASAEVAAPTMQQDVPLEALGAKRLPAPTNTTSMAQQSAAPTSAMSQNDLLAALQQDTSRDKKNTLANSHRTITSHDDMMAALLAWKGR